MKFVDLKPKKSQNSKTGIIRKNPRVVWMTRIKTFIVRRGVLLLLILLVLADTAYAGWQLTYTQPKLICNMCHNIQPYVESYSTSHYLDHVHAEANVSCKDCHHVTPLLAATEAFTYITGNAQDPMRETTLPKEACLQCHRSYESLAERTSGLEPNPHDSHLGELDCSICHKAHRASEVYCTQCHITELSL